MNIFASTTRVSFFYILLLYNNIAITTTWQKAIYGLRSELPHP